MSNIIGGNKTPQQPQIDMEYIMQNATDVICPYCEKLKQDDEPSQNIFIQAHIIKRISALQSPSGEELFIPVPIFICQVCGNQLTGEKNTDI